jgi:hypothetical protein
MVCIPMVCIPMVCIPMVCIPMVCIPMYVIFSTYLFDEFFRWIFSTNFDFLDEFFHDFFFSTFFNEFFFDYFRQMFCLLTVASFRIRVPSILFSVATSKAGIKIFWSKVIAKLKKDKLKQEFTQFLPTKHCWKKVHVFVGQRTKNCWF